MKRIFSLLLAFTLVLSLFSCSKDEEDSLSALNDNSETVSALKAVMSELGYEIARDNDKDYFTLRLNDLVALGAEFSEEDKSNGYAIIFTHPEKYHIVALCFNSRDLSRRYYEEYIKVSKNFEREAKREGGVVIIGDREELLKIKI